MATGSGDVGHGNIKKPGKEVDKAIRKSTLLLLKGQSLGAAGSMKGDNMGAKERNLTRETIRKIEEQTEEYKKMRETLEKIYQEWIKLIESKEKN